MAIGEIRYANSEALASANKTFYPLRIPVSHPQLRHYLSHPEKGILYYANGPDVYRIELGKRKREHITTLPFNANCTASGHGYICVGGARDGCFAVIKLGADVDVDAPLPTLNNPQRPSLSISPRIVQVGTEIVNSVSIHRIHDEEAHLYDVVAVLTNNDETVRIYSLTQDTQTAELRCPFPMNHATLSPDGRTLVAVGDDNKVFFYHRELLSDPPQIPKPHNRLTTSSVKWNKIGEAQLHVPDSQSTKGYFSTAWSSSGRLLAVGSEAGFITVFDVFLLGFAIPAQDTEAAIIACVPSSRPDVKNHMHPGAVRSMVFSPEPWDLLIWAEDQGRVCVGDLRTGLRVKQVIELDPKDDKLQRHNIVDSVDVLIADHASELARFRELQQEVSGRSGVSADDAGYDDDPEGLTAHEQQVLDALRTTRQAEEARVQGRAPHSVNYTSSTLFRGDRLGQPQLSTYHNDDEDFPALARLSSRRDTTRRRIRDSDQSLAVAQNTLRDVLGRPSNAQGTAGVERDNTNPTDSPRSRVIPPHARRTDANPLVTQSNRATTNTPPLSRSQQHSTGPPHRPPSSSTDPDEPWRTITNAMALARGPLFERSAEQESQAQRDDRLLMLSRQRDRLRELQSRLEEHRDAAPGTTDLGQDHLANRYELLRNATSAVRGMQDHYDVLRRRGGGRGAFVGLSTLTGVEVAVRTAGLAVSYDGRTVWCATEEGIFEIEIRVKERLQWPAVDFK